MKLYLDDCRDTPPGFDVRTYTAEETIEHLRSGKITFVSFDHDLNDANYAGSTEKSGYTVAKWIEEQAYHGNLKRIGWAVHSQNPEGAKNIRNAMLQAEKFWTQRGE